MVTIHDVARHAGVSSMTVSRTLNGQKYVSAPIRERVMAAVRELNYSMNLAAKATRAGGAAPRIGILYSNPSAAYLNEVMLGGLEQSSRTGAQLLLEKCGSLSSQKAAVKRLMAVGVDGVIVPPPLCDSRPTIDMLANEGVTVVALATARPMEHISSVRIDDYQGALAMTRYIIGLGHKKIAFIKGDPQHTPSELRYVGFCAGMEEANLEVRPEWIAPGLFTYRSGLQAAEMLLKSPDLPTAIFASNDDMAAAVIAIAHGIGLRVPEALTVCGFDDTPVASTIWPPLTTIHQPIVALGRAAVSIMVGLVEKTRSGETTEAVHQLMKFTLIERGSSAPPPA